MTSRRKPHFAQHEFLKIGNAVSQMLFDGYTRKYIYQHFLEKNELTMSYRAFLKYARKLHIPSALPTSNLASSCAKPSPGARFLPICDNPQVEANKPYTFQANPDAERLLKVHVKSED